MKTVSRCIALTLIACAQLPAYSALATEADDKFERLAAGYINEFPALSPVTATVLGDHRYDHLLDEVSRESLNQRTAFYRRYQDQLKKIRYKNLSKANQVDYELMHHDIESSLWSQEELQEWAWNPVSYSQTAGGAIYSLLAREFAPIDERLASAASRLEAMPRFLEQVREILDPARVPLINAETAARQNRGVISIMDNMIRPELENVSEASRSRLEFVMEIATAAVEEHQQWLDEVLVPNAKGDFRIGAELFDRKLAFALHTLLSREQIRERAWNEYHRVRNDMYEVSKTIYSAQYPFTEYPEAPDEAYKQAIIRAALEVVYKALPARDAIVDVVKEYLEQTTAFVREQDLVEVPDDPLEIIIMPEFQRGVAVAYCDPPGPLDKGQKTFYSVAPLPEDWSDTQVESFLREYNLVSLQDLTIHEAMPGHYLQLALSNRYPSTLRAVLASGPFVEGWAVYAEEIMVKAGYLDNDPKLRLSNLKWYLRAITNAIMDQAIHVDGMTRDEAMQLMVEGGFQEEREAAGKWVRAQLSSTQLSTYFVGYQEHLDLRREVESVWADDFTQRKYHDELLSYGSPPVQYVRALMLGEPIPKSR
ncbi:MAG: DUF885 domain-containing protein [Gammaproteobacteria bacterium]